MKRIYLFAIVLGMFFGFESIALGASGRLLTVGDPWGGPSSFDTIQAAVNEARAGNKIMIWPGTYDEYNDPIWEVLIQNKNMIRLVAYDPTDKPIVVGKFDILDSSYITLENLIIDGHLTVEGTNITVDGCEVENSATFSHGINNIELIDTWFDGLVHIYPISPDIGTRNFNIEGCTFASNNGGIDFDVYSNDAFELHVFDNTFLNTSTGIYTQRFGSYSHPNIYMRDNEFINCQTETNDDYEIYGPYASWHSTYQTPGYPNGYPDNVNESVIINPTPGDNGYLVIVDGECEYYWDKLYVKEMDGTVIHTFTGKVFNYELYIDSNRSVIVQFVSDYIFNEEGFEVWTVRDF
ncbi:MAG: hypothetical protein QNJ97_13545 [Myxococcota bacterium]|nr:hypothetical protein [Myxococcota bacterium]